MWLDVLPISSRIAMAPEWFMSRQEKPSRQVSQNLLHEFRDCLLVHEIQQALDFAQEVFPELRNIDRERISLEVHTPGSVRGQAPRSTVQIGRMAWLPVISTLSRFEVVEVCVAPAPLPAVIYSGSAAAALPPYTLEASGHRRKWGSK